MKSFAAILKYDPSQPRDAEGQFSSTGQKAQFEQAFDEAVLKEIGEGLSPLKARQRVLQQATGEEFRAYAENQVRRFEAARVKGIENRKKHKVKAARMAEMRRNAGGAIGEKQRALDFRMAVGRQKQRIARLKPED